jgi:hypothetical protein
LGSASEDKSFNLTLARRAWAASPFQSLQGTEKKKEKKKTKEKIRSLLSLAAGTGGSSRYMP